MTATPRPVVRVALALAVGIACASLRAASAATDVQPSAGGVHRLEGLAKVASVRSAQPRSLAGLGAATVAPEDCLAPGGEGPVTPSRYAGADRYETAVCTSFWTWSDHDDAEPGALKAHAVVLARGDLFPDALAGGPLAGQVEGPILLTPPTALRPNVKTEIQRVLAPGGTVYLLGGTAALSADIASELTDAGYTTKRLAGQDRYATAIAIAKELPLTSNFFFVTGRNFPDALAAGNAGAALTRAAKLDSDPNTRPFGLLLTDDTVMPAATRDFALGRRSQVGDSFFATAGGQADAAAVAAFGADLLDARLAGPNRYETTSLVAEWFFADSGHLIGSGVGLATGLTFPDALAAAATLAVFAEPLLLTPSIQLTGATRAFLEDHAADLDAAFLDVFGGTVAISNEVENAAIAFFTP